MKTIRTLSMLTTLAWLIPVSTPNVASAQQTAAGADPMSRDVGRQLQLFLDDWLVESMDRTARVLHRPRAAEIAIQLDRPWEGATLYDPSVIKDGNRYRMWYRAGGPDRPFFWAYAESPGRSPLGQARTEFDRVPRFYSEQPGVADSRCHLLDAVDLQGW